MSTAQTGTRQVAPLEVKEVGEQASMLSLTFGLGPALSHLRLRSEFAVETRGGPTWPSEERGMGRR